MIDIITADGAAELDKLSTMRSRAAQAGADIEVAVRAIMRDVKEEGFAAVARYSRRFDHREP